MYYFCTYFDCHYLTRGLALYASLTAHATPFVLWVLCFDDLTYQTLAKLNRPQLRPVKLNELEKFDPQLLEVKSQRSRIEYYFTCSPAWPRYLLQHYPDIDWLVYLDADLYFYASPAPLYQELEGYSIGIIPHRFPERLRWLEAHGIYNVGLVAFRNDNFGLTCLNWWRERCLEWCYDRAEPGRYGDQKYLDDWPQRFEKVVVIQHKGANLAPWNWMNYPIEIANKQLRLDGETLIFYHFHGLRLLNGWLFDPGVIPYGAMPVNLRRWLYQPYVQTLKEIARTLHADLPGLADNFYNVRTGYSWLRLGKRILQRQLMLALPRSGD